MAKQMQMQTFAQSAAIPTDVRSIDSCPTSLRSGDSLASLGQRYFPSLSEVDAARVIVALNDVAFTTRDINAWVIERGGRWLNQVAGQAAVPGSPTGGWAVFTSASTIFLPCGTAGPGVVDGPAKPPKRQPPPPQVFEPTAPDDFVGPPEPEPRSAGAGWLWWLIPVGAGIAWAMSDDDKKKKPRRKKRARK